MHFIPSCLSRTCGRGGVCRPREDEIREELRFPPSGVRTAYVSRRPGHMVVTHPSRAGVDGLHSGHLSEREQHVLPFHVEPEGALLASLQTPADGTTACHDADFW